MDTDFRPNRADEQRRFSAQCGLVVSCYSTVREGWVNRGRMEANREQQACEVLRADAEGTKETR